MADTYIAVSSTGPDLMDIYTNGDLVGRVTSDVGPGASDDSYITCSSTDPDVLDTYVDGVLVGRLTSDTSTTGAENTYLAVAEVGETASDEVLMYIKFDELEETTYFKEELHRITPIAGDGYLQPQNGAAIADAPTAFGGKAFVTAGGTEYINTAGAVDDFYMDGINIQIDIWIYLTAWPAVAGDIMGQGVGNWAVYIYADGRIAIGRIGTNEETAPSGISLNTKTLITITKTAAEHTKIYVNGVAKIETDLDVWADSLNSLKIGTIATGTITGYYDECRFIWGSILNTTDFTPPDTEFYGTPTDHLNMYVDNTQVLEVDST